MKLRSIALYIALSLSNFTMAFASESNPLFVEETSDQLQLIYKFLGGDVDTILKMKPKRILLLGDAGVRSIADQIGPLLRKSGIEIYKTDFSIEGKKFNDDKKIYEMHVNHLKPLPFRDNYFDLIIGSRILCQCNTKSLSTTCGGINMARSGQLEEFMYHVARVLNKDNEKSIAVLGGYDHKISVMESFRTSRAFESSVEKVARYYEETFNFLREVHVEEGLQMTRVGLIIGNYDI